MCETFGGKTVTVPHPIPYQGSKRRLAPVIAAYCPPDTERLIEPFAGSAAVSLHAARHGTAKAFILNDLNAPLMALWEQVINHPDLIAAGYAELWEAQRDRERDFYDEVRTRFNRKHEPACLLYLLARCVKASVRYNANGEFNQSPDNRRRGAHPSTMGRHIASASALLRGRTLVSALDYRDVLPLATARDVIYMDPPYQGVCGGRDQRYLQGVRLDEFVEALAGLNDAQASFIVSYDGRTGDKWHGDILPERLGLDHILIDAGPSTQATLLGRRHQTVESLYLSPALLRRMAPSQRRSGARAAHQLHLLEVGQ
jgi:DNA adenine methylase